MGCRPREALRCVVCALSEVCLWRGIELASLPSPSGLCSCAVSRNTACLALLVTSYGENQVKIVISMHPETFVCGKARKKCGWQGRGALLGILPKGGLFLPSTVPLPDPSYSQLLFSSLQVIVCLPLKPHSACRSSSQSQL